jgi:hypothetical protein
MPLSEAKLAEPSRCRLGCDREILSAILFNKALHVAMYEVRMGGTIVYRTKQAFAYADDIALVGRNLDSHTEIFDTLEEKSRALALRINEERTRCMMSLSEERRWTTTVTL